MASRARGRDVHIYSANDTTRVLGGLHLGNGMTNANFYSMVEIVFVFDNDYTLSNESGATVQRDDHPLQKGKYFINTAGSRKFNNEPWMARTISVGAQAPPEEFRDAVRVRDRGCFITGQTARGAAYGDWTGYTATPIFPVTHEQDWATHGHDSWITIPGTRGPLTSVQNGMLLRSDISHLFENYHLSINPDDGYKIVSFIRDPPLIAGTHLDKTVLGNPERPVDQLLRWHFRQTVLANVRAEGEPCFDAEHCF
ncbi:hypothetical protein B9Z19DRAFT_1149666 [Tuber borchii]|uniref:Uncharacterized protein n=1 Tax=Tuber borchii TaxID=42251 RepID=A0A2T7A5J8_TUBBO|nr:hypothetical protein B9Z19DRAFT_1149666 [Tuber borchii]